METVELSLLKKNGEMPKKSGLNWGQRLARERNQAYIKVPSTIYKTDFFPGVTERFTLSTDDNQTFECVIAQQNGKAIETPNNNSLLGLYFRERLGVAIDAVVLMEHLEAYGRTSVTITKRGDLDFLLDFSR